MRERHILAEALDQVEWAWGPQLALVVFTLFMCGVFAWLLRPGAKAAYAAIGLSALDREDQHAG